MAEVKVPKWFKDRLSDDEKVISKYKHFYATNKRLIRSKSNSEFDFLNYDKVQITIKNWIIGNTIFLIAATAFIWAGLLSPDIKNLEFLNEFMFLLGIGFIIAIIFIVEDYRISFLKEVSSGLSSLDRTRFFLKWQIQYNHFACNKVLNFANTVQGFTGNSIIFKKPSLVRKIIAFLSIILWFAFIIWITGMMRGIFPVPP